jgi:rare lipoprotein A
MLMFQVGNCFGAARLHTRSFLFVISVLIQTIGLMSPNTWVYDATAQVQPSATNKQVRKTSVASARPQTIKVLRGKASWYGPGFHGKKTASGEVFDQQKLTAAHKTIPLGSKAIVTNLNNGNSVEVEINDRGPYIPGRIIDLSEAAASVLGFVASGTAPVRVELLASNDKSTDTSETQQN